MKVQVNSDKTIRVDARLVTFVEGEAERVLARFAGKLTRVEIHLADVDNKKTGQADKRCVVEARPAGAQPLSTTANSVKVATAVDQALAKMKRLLTTFFGRMGRTPVTIGASAVPARKTAAKKTVAKKAIAKKTGTKKVAAKKKALSKKAAGILARDEPKKKRIYQARRKAWPTR